MVTIKEEAQGVLDAVEEVMPDGDGGGQAPGWLDALRVLWPLSVVARVATVPMELREVAARGLARVRGATGLQRGAVKGAEPVIVPASIHTALGRDVLFERLLCG